jgi:hypothetical protein
MIQPGQRAGLAVEAFREVRIGAQFQRQQLERDEAVQLRLPRLVNEAHAATPDQLDNLQVRESRAQGLRRRRLRARHRFAGVGRGSGAQQDTPRAKSLRRVRRDGDAALRTFRDGRFRVHAPAS